MIDEKQRSLYKKQIKENSGISINKFLEDRELDIIYQHRFLKKNNANLILKQLKEYTKKHGWTTKRHANYPTTDIPAIKIRPLRKKVQAILNDIYVFIENKYTLNIKNRSKVFKNAL